MMQLALRVSNDCSVQESPPAISNTDDSAPRRAASVANISKLMNRSKEDGQYLKEGTVDQVRLHRGRHQYCPGEEYRGGQVVEEREDQSDMTGSREAGDIANTIEFVNKSKEDRRYITEGSIAQLRVCHNHHQHRLGEAYGTAQVASMKSNILAMRPVIFSTAMMPGILGCLSQVATLGENTKLVGRNDMPNEPALRARPASVVLSMLLIDRDLQSICLGTAPPVSNHSRTRPSAALQHVGDALGHLLSISDGEHLGLLVVGGDLAGKNQRHHARLQARRASDTSGTSISSARCHWKIPPKDAQIQREVFSNNSRARPSSAKAKNNGNGEDNISGHQPFLATCSSAEVLESHGYLAGDFRAASLSPYRHSSAAQDARSHANAILPGSDDLACKHGRNTFEELEEIAKSVTRRSLARELHAISVATRRRSSTAQDARSHADAILSGLKKSVRKGRR
ncbi:hypothetical protein Q7P35_006654 [Cladosporium inversicolor]